MHLGSLAGKPGRLLFEEREQAPHIHQMGTAFYGRSNGAANLARPCCLFSLRKDHCLCLTFQNEKTIP